jgi:hypothetical protein
VDGGIGVPKTSWSLDWIPSLEKKNNVLKIERSVHHSLLFLSMLITDITCIIHLRYESPYWRCLAATRIQVAWRYKKKRLCRTTLHNQIAKH